MKGKNITLSTIIHVAKINELVRGAVLNGSRANPDAPTDELSDFDVIYVVRDVALLVEDKSWLEPFGDRLIMQEPDAMDGAWPKQSHRYAFLMQFTDGNRIDLTLIEKKHYENSKKDSLSRVLLDKDQNFLDIPHPSESDYLPAPPSQKEFFNCCNEFFWVSLYVAKGLARNQVVYAKAMLEQHVRQEFIRLLIWYAGILTGFSKNMGNCGKYLDKYLDESTWQAILATYTDHQLESMWPALLAMCDLFDRVAAELSKHFNFPYNHKEYVCVVNYMEMLRKSLKC